MEEKHKKTTKEVKSVVFTQTWLGNVISKILKLK